MAKSFVLTSHSNFLCTRAKNKVIEGIGGTMQRDGEARGNWRTSSSPFDSFGGFPGSMLPGTFGGKYPFDDPFLSRPHSSLFGSELFRSRSPGNLQQTSKSKGPVIEELDSDAEEVPDQEEENNVHGAAWKNRNPVVDHSEDQADDKLDASCLVSPLTIMPNMADHEKITSNVRGVSYTTNHEKVESARPQTHSVSFQRVTYGGINGAYYTATTSRRTGADGLTLEESKEADRTSGQATHRISREIHDKGHSVTRTLDSDGKVDTVQTLHNLHEDELMGFEQAWGARQFHGWNNAFDFPGNFGTSGTKCGQLTAWGGFTDPFRELPYRNSGLSSKQNLRGQSGQGRPKKVVTINIE